MRKKHCLRGQWSLGSGGQWSRVVVSGDPVSGGQCPAVGRHSVPGD